MLEDLAYDVIENNNCIITSSTGNGATSLTLFFLNKILTQDRVIIYYCPTIIDCNFVAANYKNVYKKVCFIFSPLTDFLLFLQSIRYTADLIVIDPGDILLIDKSFFESLVQILKASGTSILCTSQIRQIPDTGQVYSTLERFNEQEHKKGIELFKYGIWIRNTTSEDLVFKHKFIDVFSIKREGNKMISRSLARVDKKLGSIAY